MSHVETIHITNGPPINLAASIHVISHVDSRHGPDSFHAIKHLQADAQVPQIAVSAHRAIVRNHRPMTHAGQATDPPAGIGTVKRRLRAIGTYASVVDPDRSHALSLPDHARPQPLAGYVAEQTADRSATRNTQDQVHITNQDHTRLGVIPTVTCHRETRPGVPERELDPRGTEISRINIILPEMDPAQQPLAEYTAVAPFLADSDDNTSFIGPLLCPIKSTPILGKQGPRILATIEDTTVPVLLDTGAELTVMSKEKMDALVHTRVHSESKPVTCFGGNKVFLEGPRCLRLELCGVKLVHPVYIVDHPSPVIIGFDAISAAQLIIDAHRRVAYSHFNYKGHPAKPMSACPNVETSGVEPARHLCTSSFDPPSMSVVDSRMSTPVFERCGAVVPDDGARADELAEVPIPFRLVCPDSEAAVSNPTPPSCTSG